MIERWVVAAVAAALMVSARAQNPFFEAARANAAAAPLPPAGAAAVVRVFLDGCVAHEGESMKTVDWAINQGFEWVDANTGAGATLLSGRPGTVLALPGSGAPVLMAIDLDKRCTVWAERAEGPAVRSELQRALGDLAGRGAGRAQPALERSVERAGAWRQQSQWRWRRTGGSQDFMLGAVTTLAPQPTAQVLNLAPAPSRLDVPSTDPIGLPQR